MGLRREAERAKKSGAAEEREMPRQARADHAHMYNAGMRIVNDRMNEIAAAHEERPEKTRPDGGGPSGGGVVRTGGFREAR